MVNAMSRELILRSMVDRLREFYDYIIIDCMPSLGMMTINALACADSVLIPVQAAYLPVKGLQQLIKTIGRVKKQMNPKLKIEGILLTMVDNRTNYARDISLMVYDTYSASIKVFGTEIPMSVRALEVSVEGGSIYSYDQKMVDANIQREEILPSEKAFAYKMKLDALKRTAGRPTKENACHNGTHLRSDQELALQVGDSARSIQRYIRLALVFSSLYISKRREKKYSGKKKTRKRNRAILQSCSANGFLVICS